MNFLKYRNYRNPKKYRNYRKYIKGGHHPVNVSGNGVTMKCSKWDVLIIIISDK